MSNLFAKKYKLYIREPCRQIIMERPKQRYIKDLTYIPSDLCKSTKFKYLLNIVDHFSKFIISYPIEKKKGPTIKSKLEECFKKYGYPEQVGSDNGSELVKKIVKNFLSKLNINFIHRIERAFRTIRNALICQYLDNIK